MKTFAIATVATSALLACQLGTAAAQDASNLTSANTNANGVKTAAAAAALTAVATNGTAANTEAIQPMKNGCGWECERSKCVGMANAQWGNWYVACQNSRYSFAGQAKMWNQGFLTYKNEAYVQCMCSNELNSYGSWDSWGANWNWIQLGDDYEDGCYYRKGTDEWAARNFWNNWKCTTSPWAGTTCTQDSEVTGGFSQPWKNTC